MSVLTHLGNEEDISRQGKSNWGTRERSQVRVDTYGLLCRHTWSRLTTWASLVAQWLRICLPMQGTRVQALVWEDPTCRGATRPVSHNY